jgi:hypothetical protein
MRPRDILAANLIQLMADRPDLGTFKKITEASDGRLSNGTLDRIRRATHATDVDSVGELARTFGVQPWQLMVKGLNPKALPQLAGPELLASIRSLLQLEAVAVNPVTADHPEQETVMASDTKKVPDRLPGERIRTGQAKGKLSAPNQSGAVPQKGSRRRA